MNQLSTETCRKTGHILTSVHIGPKPSITFCMVGFYLQSGDNAKFNTAGDLKQQYIRFKLLNASRRLSSLNMATNNLSGIIPEELENGQLLNLNLSCNSSRFSCRQPLKILLSLTSNKHILGSNQLDDSVLANIPKLPKGRIRFTEEELIRRKSTKISNIGHSVLQESFLLRCPSWDFNFVRKWQRTSTIEQLISR
ncbi:hypothetical protein Leryth_010957 [Lithospermum erythrorhizon]|nr:hypothetical protein Leryth_010957 [Lithospermum erythrorhizon]